MINKTLLWTAFFSALFTALSLKFLHLFNFISWSPVGWVKKGSLFGSPHIVIQWALFFIILTVVFAIIYFAVSFTSSIPPSVTSLIIAIIAVFAIEWTIGSPKTPFDAIKSVSIPFLAIIAMVLRFITGTAVFMKKFLAESVK
ncbi:hypothetical protein [Sporosarcina sp. YIM B06819]|uniref:hypothetical protein n=1 Tax=Sporosarcina sp. YIM B06819 TaxID=3081769 RepID=UPI00298BD623|nr:hypothetical protein [Sporosarcina sp. YIM B06819]